MKAQVHSQASRIIGLLATGKGFSKLDLIRRGCGTKPDTRISELRRQRHSIKDKWVTRGGSRFKVYWLDRKNCH